MFSILLYFIGSLLFKFIFIRLIKNCDKFYTKLFTRSNAYLTRVRTTLVRAVANIVLLNYKTPKISMKNVIKAESFTAIQNPPWTRGGGCLHLPCRPCRFLQTASSSRWAGR